MRRRIARCFETHERLRRKKVIRRSAAGRTWQPDAASDTAPDTAPDALPIWIAAPDQMRDRTHTRPRTNIRDASASFHHSTLLAACTLSHFTAVHNIDGHKHDSRIASCN